MHSFPTFYKNPFIKSIEDLYFSIDLFKRLTYADYTIIPFSKINRRLHTIKKTRVIGADTRYPGIVYKAELDAMYDKKFSPLEYCIFDGTHRFYKMRDIEGSLLNEAGFGDFVIFNHLNGVSQKSQVYFDQ